ncbi:MAG: hypothetical protein PHX82_00610 [Paracoccaceae bacterium]|nr:hypothetical protein [Paracoccaceae bacterium]
MTIMKRGSTYRLRKRVPRRYEGVEERKSIWVSLHTDSLTVAQQKAPIAWQHIVEGWEARLAGDTSDAEKRFEAAKNLAAVRGFRYLPVARVAELPRKDYKERMYAVIGKDGEPDIREAAGVRPVAPGCAIWAEAGIRNCRSSIARWRKPMCARVCQVRWSIWKDRGGASGAGSGTKRVSRGGGSPAQARPKSARHRPAKARSCCFGAVPRRPDAGCFCSGGSDQSKTTIHIIISYKQ